MDFRGCVHRRLLAFRIAGQPPSDSIVDTKRGSRRNKSDLYVMGSISIGTREPAFAGSLGFVQFAYTRSVNAELYALRFDARTTKVVGRSHPYTRVYPGRLDRKRH